MLAFQPGQVPYDELIPSPHSPEKLQITNDRRLPTHPRDKSIQLVLMAASAAGTMCCCSPMNPLVPPTCEFASTHRMVY